MIRPAHRRQLLAGAYIYALAARGGFNITDRLPRFGVITLSEVIEEEGAFFESGFSIDLRVEITTPARMTATHISHDLDVVTYEVLQRGRGVPGILVLVVMPDDEDTWLDQTAERMELRTCAYWLSLRGMPATRNKRTVRVSIPRANVLSANTLTQMITQLRTGELP